MKFIYALAFGSLNLLATNMLAQKDEMRLNLCYWSVNNYEMRTGAALSYFRAVSAGHLVGVKFNFDTDALANRQD